MDLTEFYRRFSSDTVAGSANQLLCRLPQTETFTGRVAYRLSHGGRNYSLLFSNLVDSTFAWGEFSKPGDSGEPWQIHEMRAGLSSAWDEWPDVTVPVTFDGEIWRTVGVGDTFCTDPIPLCAEGGQYLHLEMTFSGISFPYHKEIIINVQKKSGDGEFVADNTMPVPLMIGSDRTVTRRIGFIGDSITQGIGTPSESYKHWVAQISEKLPPSVSVWDLGIGCARAYDASSDGCFLARAKKCDVVNICFGVNDIIMGRCAEEVICDLEKINGLLREAGCKTVVFTAPPFDFKDQVRDRWETVNSYIRHTLAGKADGFFDFAKYTSKDAPDDNLSKYGGHPDVEGCAVIADAYLSDVDILKM